MQYNFTKLKQALQDPADGPYALERVRLLLLEALQDWPLEKYLTTDYLLPWGRPIAKRSRCTIEGLLIFIESPAARSTRSIFKMAKMLELVKW